MYICQVINHGVPADSMDEMMRMIDEFFSLPDEDKASVYSEDPTKMCRLHTSSYKYADEKIHFWRDCLRHLCNPLDEFIHTWPEKPFRYR